jgi:hypothetical protein
LDPADKVSHQTSKRILKFVNISGGIEKGAKNLELDQFLWWYQGPSIRKKWWFYLFCYTQQQNPYNL